MTLLTTRTGTGRSRTARRIGAALAGAALISGAALVGSPAAYAGPLQTAPLAAEQGETSGCKITDARMTWGVKESFRSYISGSIANGEWKTADGADYETPDFIWSAGTGSYDPAAGTGSVAFDGSVSFSGHDGVLNLVIANPTIEFTGDGARLLMDTSSNDMEGEVAVDEKQVELGLISKVGALDAASGTASLDAVPVTLSESGATAFAGFYEAGAELDPLTLSMTFAPCDIAAPSTPGESGSDSSPTMTQGGDVARQSAPIPWAPIVVGGVAVLVIGLTAGLLIAGRKMPVKDPSGEE